MGPTSADELRHRTSTTAQGWELTRSNGHKNGDSPGQQRTPTTSNINNYLRRITGCGHRRHVVEFPTTSKLALSPFRSPRQH